MINASADPSPLRTAEQKRKLLLELLAETEPIGGTGAEIFVLILATKP